MSAPYRCPICDGRGTVPPGFYPEKTGRQTCKACMGWGVIIAPDTYPMPVPVVPLPHSPTVRPWWEPQVIYTSETTVTGSGAGITVSLAGD